MIENKNENNEQESNNGLVGEKFSTHKEGMTITSRSGIIDNSYTIVEYVDADTIKAELTSTNQFMYSGSGYFEEFKITEVLKHNKKLKK